MGTTKGPTKGKKGAPKAPVVSIGEKTSSVKNKIVRSQHYTKLKHEKNVSCHQTYGVQSASQAHNTTLKLSRLAERQTRSTRQEETRGGQGRRARHSASSEKDTEGDVLCCNSVACLSVIFTAIDGAALDS